MAYAELLLTGVDATGILAWIPLGVNLTEARVAQPPLPKKRSLIDLHIG